MRLLAVRLQNLNSLSGRSHEVRFDAPPLSQAGVFLITGPTGAGKSTLLDAITLALYGRAARYGNDKADEMMSRHTAECQAEVDFEAGGKRLRATWRLRRARGRAEGALQPVERRLSRADTGEILAERSREIDQMVEQLTGLDCQRFLRSVLLAQGQFAAFLKAKPNERAELLEKITGTGIYSELSILAYRTYDEKQKEVTRLKDRLGCLAIMPDEERAEVEKQLSQSQSAISGLQSEHTAALKRFNDLKLLQQHQHDHAAVSGEIERLNETLQSLARQQAAAVAMVQQAQAKTEAARNARAAREPVWDQAAQLTAKWQAFEAQLTESRDTYRKHFAEHKAATTLQAEKEKLLVEHDRSAAALNDWLMQHAEDAALAAQITQLRAALPEWRKAHLALQEGKRLHGEKQALIQKQAGHQAAEKLLAAQLRDLRQGLVANHADLTRITAACDQQRKVVEHAQTVAGFEEHRLDLKAGEACPLCGATEHPFATDSVNFISQLQSSRQLLHSLEQQRDKMQRATAGAEQEVARAEARLDAELKWLAEVVENLRQMRAPDDAALVHLQTEEARRRLTIAATPDDAERVVAGLERRAQTYAESVSRGTVQQAQRQKLESELQLARQDAEAKAKRLEELRAEGIRLKETADAVQKDLSELLGERSLDADRQWHAEQVATAEQVSGRAETAVHDLQSRAAAGKATLNQQEKRREELAVQLKGQPPVTPESMAEAELAMETLATQLAAGQRHVGSLQERLRHDDEARKQREAGGREVEAAEAETMRWGRLKELIGSADGARFARFAQSLTLRQLVSLANHHLHGLTPRYRLMAVSGDELDLRIVDLYQAGVDRPMESLSGGESFLASLALALGLSELASRHHPIDSLFIDEGFGTLDGDTLETAMAALENLRANGKSIGVISHVEAMKERITTQIRVTKLDGGCSRLEVVG